MKRIILLINIFIGFQLNAQQELGLHFVNQVWQSNNTNPAITSEKNVVIGLPSFYTEASVKGLRYNDFVKSADGTTPSSIDVNNLIANAPDLNAIRLVNQLDVMSVGVRIKKLFISAGVSVKTGAYIAIPKTMLDFAWNGNAKYIGKTIDLGLDVDIFAYNEKYLGLAYKISDKLNVATRVKYLGGAFAVSTDKNLATLYTNPEIYQLTLKTDYRISTANGINYKGKGDFSTVADFNNLDGQELAFTTSNKGFSLDLGATYQLNDKIQLAASVTDLGGKINWKNNVTNLSNQGENTFKGLDFGIILRGDTTTYNKVMDTLAQKFDFKTTNEAFVTKLPTRFYLSGIYKVNETVHVGALFFSETYRGIIRPAFAINGGLSSSIVQIGATWAYRNGTAANVGISAVLKLGPIQFFGITDNIIPIFSLNSSALNINTRFGMNLIFGKKKKIIEVVTPEIPIKK